MIDFDAPTTIAICAAGWLIRTSLSKLEVAVRGLGDAVKAHVDEDTTKHAQGDRTMGTHNYRLDRIERLLFIPPVDSNSSGAMPDTQEKDNSNEQ